MRTHTLKMQSLVHHAAMAALRLKRQKDYAEVLGFSAAMISRVLCGHIFPAASMNERAARLMARVHPDEGDALEVLAAKFDPGLDVREAFLFRPQVYKADSYIRVMEGLLWVSWKYPVAKYDWIDWYERDIRLKPRTRHSRNRYGRPPNPMDNIQDAERPLVVARPVRGDSTARTRPRSKSTYGPIRDAILAR